MDVACTTRLVHADSVVTIDHGAYQGVGAAPRGGGGGGRGRNNTSSKVSNFFEKGVFLCDAESFSSCSLIPRRTVDA